MYEYDPLHGVPEQGGKKSLTHAIENLGRKGRLRYQFQMGCIETRTRLLWSANQGYSLRLWYEEKGACYRDRSGPGTTGELFQMLLIEAPSNPPHPKKPEGFHHIFDVQKAKFF